MTFDDLYKCHVTHIDLSWFIKMAVIAHDHLTKHKEALTRLLEKAPNPGTRIDSNGIWLYFTTREETVAALEAFGGKWKRSVDADGDIVYSQPGIEICGKPPPSCKIETYDEDIPARTITKRRLICGTVDEPVEVTSD